MRQTSRFGRPPDRLLLCPGDLVRHRDLYTDQLVTLSAVFLDTLPLDAEPPAWLGARRNAQQNLLAVQGANPEPGTERCLCQVDRDIRHNVEALAAEEPVGLHLKCDYQISGRSSRAAGLPLPSQQDP